MDYKSKRMPINKKMILIFSFVMIVTIIMIRLFVATLFQHSFERYVDDSNKVELYHLMNFDARGLYRNDEWDMDFIKNLGIDAIQKGIAIKVYDHSGKELWSVFSDEKVLSDYTLNEISQNMQNIDSDWSNALEDYQVDIYNERDEVVGKLDLTHYASTYYMSNDLELLNTVNQVILIIGIVSVGSIVVVSAMISKSISIPIVKVSRMAKLIETGQYKKEVETRSDIKE
ncbi:MAG: sensor histidine kinase, partial [Turicibacter sanguinis]